MKKELLSTSIVTILNELKDNNGLAMLLVNNSSTPFLETLPDINKSELVNPNSSNAKIFPYPFDVEAETKDGSFVRVYFNQGAFDGSEVIHDADINIDIVVAKSLWLINDKQTKSSIGKALIRPYEILARVVDIIGRRNRVIDKGIRLKIDGWQHLAVNTKFDAIRIYCSYTTIEN